MFNIGSKFHSHIAMRGGDPNMDMQRMGYNAG